MLPFVPIEPFTCAAFTTWQLVRQMIPGSGKSGAPLKRTTRACVRRLTPFTVPVAVTQRGARLNCGSSGT